MVHTCFIEAGDRSPDWSPEPGIESALKTPQELAAMIKNGEFKQQIHLGALMLAELRGFLRLPR